MSIQISAVCGDVLKTTPDVLLLKYSNANRGADLAVATAIGEGPLSVERGEHKFFQTGGKVGARELLVIGVGALESFEYREIERFAKVGLEVVCRERPGAEVIALTIHGPGYGLDELAAVDSLVRGLKAGAVAFGNRDVRVVIIEKWAPRAKRVQDFLNALSRDTPDTTGFVPSVAASIGPDRAYSKRLFAAMPFKSKFLDHWDFALQPAAHEANLLIERIDHTYFSGEIIAEIRNRICKCAAVVALIDEGNPNVFLEVGYAWGVGRPTIMALHVDSEPPFDVRAHKILRYGRVGELRALVAGELAGLAKQGIL